MKATVLFRFAQCAAS